jgi:hypothetical protein
MLENDSHASRISVAGWRLQGRGQRQGLGGEGFRMDGGARRTSAQTRSLEKVLEAWAEEWAKEGKKVDWHKLLPPRGFQVLPRRWVVERSLWPGSATTAG